MHHPNLFVLGAQKAGTTYLSKVLFEHQDVYFSDPKETMFFSQGDRISTEAYSAYCEKYYAGHTTEKWCGEGSTTYLQRPKVLQQIRNHVPGAPKFIVCMRQPVDKAVSFFVHNWRRGRHEAGVRMQDTFEQPIGLSPLKSSRYANSIERWFEAYPRENFLFLKFDDLKADPAAFVKQATDFLGINEAKIVPDKRINVGMPILVEGNQLRVVADKSDKEDLLIAFEDLAAIMRRCRRDVIRTEALTGLDLSDWLKMPKFD